MSLYVSPLTYLKNHTSKLQEIRFTLLAAASRFSDGNVIGLHTLGISGFVDEMTSHGHAKRAYIQHASTGLYVCA